MPNFIIQPKVNKKPLNQNKMENGKQMTFPITIEDNGNASVTHLGLTKREYFAGLAMQGYTGQLDIESIAKWSVEMADALLKALETKSE